MDNYLHDHLKKRISDELEKQGVRNIDLSVALQMVNDVKEWEEDEDDLNDDYGLISYFLVTYIFS